MTTETTEKILNSQGFAHWIESPLGVVAVVLFILLGFITWKVIDYLRKRSEEERATSNKLYDDSKEMQKIFTENLNRSNDTFSDKLKDIIESLKRVHGRLEGVETAVRGVKK